MKIKTTKTKTKIKRNKTRIERTGKILIGILTGSFILIITLTATSIGVSLNIKRESPTITEVENATSLTFTESTVSDSTMPEGSGYTGSDDQVYLKGSRKLEVLEDPYHQIPIIEI